MMNLFRHLFVKPVEIRKAGSKDRDGWLYGKIARTVTAWEQLPDGTIIRYGPTTLTFYREEAHESWCSASTMLEQALAKNDPQPVDG